MRGKLSHIVPLYTVVVTLYLDIETKHATSTERTVNATSDFVFSISIKKVFMWRITHTNVSVDVTTMIN